MIYLYTILTIIAIWKAKGLILNIISKMLFVILMPLNFIAILIKYINANAYWKRINLYLFNDAFETDIFAHHNFRAFWNLTSSKGGTKFGVVDMTLSAMIGLKKQEKTLTGLLWFFYYILYAIDYKEWKNGGHCISAYNMYKNIKNVSL